MERMSCDLVVIGSGGAGMVAAGHAAVLGAKVIVLEKNKLIGGNTWFAVGTRYINSRRGRENGKSLSCRLICLSHNYQSPFR